MHKINLYFLLILFTIPIHTKNSISTTLQKCTKFFQRSKIDITHHEFNNIQTIDLTNLHGSISVEPWKQPCVLIELRKKGSDQFLTQTKLQAKAEQNHLKATVKLADEKLHGTLDVHILVPENVSIKLTTQSHQICTQKHHGPQELTSSSGNIIVTEGSNTVVARTKSATITVQRKKMSLGAALNLYSDSGNIVLMVPQEIDMQLEANTATGLINSSIFVLLDPQHIQLNPETFEHMKHHVCGWIGQPSNHENPAACLLTTNSGNISILPYKK